MKSEYVYTNALLGVLQITTPEQLVIIYTESNSFSGCFPAECTGRQQKRGTCVCPPVSLQLVTACEPLATQHPAAHKRPLPRMPAQVCSQVGSLSVHFPTAGDVADVLLLLPCAGSSVRNKSGMWGSCCLFPDEGGEHVPPGLTHLPPDSLQLGQVHATLRSLLPSWPIWSSSSTILPRRCDRSLVFRVESVLSCQSPESGSSFIWMSAIISTELWVKPWTHCHTV